MKILKIIARGIPLFKDEFIINFCAQQRILNDDKDSLYNLFSNIYLNPICAIIGINASGKSTSLKIISLALDIINGKSINYSPAKDVLMRSKKVNFEIYFYGKNNEILKLDLIINSIVNEASEDEYKIQYEKLYCKKTSEVRTKKSLFNFEEDNTKYERSSYDLLQDDVSIALKYIKENNDSIFSQSLLFLTNMNILLPLTKDFKVPLSLLKFLDSSVESISIDNNQDFATRLKLKNQDEMFFQNPTFLNRYLSSGTIKGITDFLYAINILKFGGILLIDEIENHYNKEIVKTLINLFDNTETNKNGAVLIFSTHYPELMDVLCRNDCINIVRKNELMTIDNLSNLITRNDLKKSEIYQSDTIKGTAPSYSRFIEFKKELLEILNPQGLANKKEQKTIDKNILIKLKRFIDFNENE